MHLEDAKYGSLATNVNFERYGKKFVTDFQVCLNYHFVNIFLLKISTFETF